MAAKKTKASKVGEPETDAGDLEVGSNGDAILTLSEKELNLIVNQVKLIGDKTRARILLLVNGERNVNEIGALIKQSQPAISHHLALLRHGGMVEATRHGKTNHYHLSEKAQKAVSFLKGFLETE